MMRLPRIGSLHTRFLGRLRRLGAPAVRGAALAALTVISAAAIATTACAGTIAPTGRWLTPDGDGVIQIAPCGDALCGWIVGFPDLAAGEAPPVDVHGRSQCRLAIMTAVQPDGENHWSGRITNPEDGRSYGVTLSLDEAGRLRLRGYVLVPLFGSTQIWTPFHGRLAADCRAA